MTTEDTTGHNILLRTEWPLRGTCGDSAAITTSTLPPKFPSPLSRSEACRSGTVFATRTFAVQQTQGALFASGGALQLAPLVFFSFFLCIIRYSYLLREGCRFWLSERYRQPDLQGYNLHLLMYDLLHRHMYDHDFFLFRFSDVVLGCSRVCYSGPRHRCR